jgi:tetratricopeptide (TPR) repeat protein
LEEAAPLSQTCEQFERDGTIARYVAGGVGRAEAVRFENHYLECKECFDAVVLGAGVRAALKTEPARRVSRPFSTRMRVASFGIAAVLATLLLMRGATVIRLQGLGATTAPAYGGVEVRAAESVADATFESAMASYSARHYDKAAAQLSEALRGGVDPLPAQFFLGASLLELNETAAAADAFRSVIAAGDSPYLAEAHFYLAKSLLRMGRGEEALTHLRAIPAGVDPIHLGAAALADSVEKVVVQSFSKL